jgi:hypothetical protein
MERLLLVVAGPFLAGLAAVAMDYLYLLGSDGEISDAGG